MQNVFITGCPLPIGVSLPLSGMMQSKYHHLRVYSKSSPPKNTSTPNYSVPRYHGRAVFRYL
jgi:hypothetical protein